MLKYSVVPLSEYINKLGEEKFKELAENFKLSKSSDVEKFLIKNALKFEKANLTRTYLFMNLEIDKLMERNELIGYFSISNNKTIDVGCVSLEDRKKFFKSIIGYKDMTHEGVFLIGQLGRNDQYTHNELSGENMLNEIYQIITKIVQMGGGRIIALECKSILRRYYEQRFFKYVQTNNKNELDLLLRNIEEIQVI